MQCWNEACPMWVRTLGRVCRVPRLRQLSNAWSEIHVVVGEKITSVTSDGTRLPSMYVKLESSLSLSLSLSLLLSLSLSLSVVLRRNIIHCSLSLNAFRMDSYLVSNVEIRYVFHGVYQAKICE